MILTFWTQPRDRPCTHPFGLRLADADAQAVTERQEVGERTEGIQHGPLQIEIEAHQARGTGHRHGHRGFPLRLFHQFVQIEIGDPTGLLSLSGSNGLALTIGGY